jgi:protocatechuate 3,4-dioxygenase beta subunit
VFSGKTDSAMKGATKGMDEDRPAGQAAADRQRNVRVLSSALIITGLLMVIKTESPAADTANPTPAAIEGPFFRPNAPRRTSLLEPGITGTKLVLTGRVLSTDGKPINGARLDFWHSDGKGEYDNAGYKLRGHQLTNHEGQYRLETIVPGQYGGRTPHIHVKVQAPNGRILTTQLYFPGEPRNQRDVLFNPDLVMKVQDAAGGKVATFDFVLDVK